MGNYSNLFKSGGISSSASRRGGRKGGKMLFIFILLCAVATVIVWYKVSGSDQKKPAPEQKLTQSASPSVPREQVQTPDKPAELPNMPEIKPVTLNKTPPSEIKSSLPPEKLAKAKSDLSKALTAMAQEDYVVARDTARSVLDSGIRENEKIWQRAADVLSKANIGIYMTDVPAPEKKLYTIKEGDNLVSIAKKFGTTVEAIQKSNGLNPANPIIFPGKTLYIYTGKWSIKVSKSKYRLYLYDNNKLFKVYKVGVGRQGRTPTGTFKITTKQKEPIWYNEGRGIPFGDKRNVLGTRWMALTPTGDTNKNLHGYGIHGTWKPESIGTKCSNGCIRMKNDDVNELYTIVPYRTPVTIED